MKKNLEEKSCIEDLPTPTKSLEFWKTISLKNDYTSCTLIDALSTNFIHLSFEILQFFELNDIAKSRMIAEVDLVRVSLLDMGFPFGTSRKNVFSKARDLGLKACPEYLAPLLRLDYLNQPKGEEIQLATEPIWLRKQINMFFLLRHDSEGLWLDMAKVSPTEFCQSSDQWIFCKA